MSTRRLAFVCAIALCSAAGLAQSSAPAKPADKQPAPPAAKPEAKPTTTPAVPAAKPGDKPAAPAAGGMPGQPSAEMAQYMEKCMAAGIPGPMHEWLAKSAGTWDGQCTFYMPGMPETKSTCTTTITSFLDGRFVKGETKGMMEMAPGQQMPFHGFMVTGYNNTTKKFEQTWIDSMGTMMMNSLGTLSADTKTLTWTSNYTCPASEKVVTSRMVETHAGPNAMTLEMWGPNPMDGKDMKMMEIKYTRGAAKPAETKADPKATAPAIVPGK